MKPSDVTICTVLTPAHRALFYKNYLLTEGLNPQSPPLWLAAFNTRLHITGKWVNRLAVKIGRDKGVDPNFSSEWVQKELSQEIDLPALCPNLTLTSGPDESVVRARISSELPEGISDEERESLIDRFYGSYAHALALGTIVPRVTTRYLLILDPDFYIVRPNWATELPRYLRDKGLGIFGVPWHPRWFFKYRDFPSIHCLLIDRNQAPIGPEHLMPNVIRTPTMPSDFWLDLGMKRAHEPKKERLKFLATHFLSAIREDRRQRKQIGKAQDTGYGIYAAFNGKVKHECAIPSFDPPREGFQPKSVLKIMTKKPWENLFPRNQRYLARDSYCSLEFRRLGYPDPKVFSWEEFFWRGNPFGFHVRGEQHRQLHGRVPDDHLSDILNESLRRVESPIQIPTTIPGA